MKRQRRPTIEYRSYEVPSDLPVLALLGDGWIRPYGEQGPAALHFHNHLEIGYCYSGHGHLYFPDQTVPYVSGVFSIIPHNVCHTTVSADGVLSCCEYLFVDADRFILDTYADTPRFGEQFMQMVNQKVLCGTEQSHPTIHRLILSLIEEMRAKKPLYAVSVRGLLSALMVEIARCAEDGPLQETIVQAKMTVIFDSLEYINQHYSENIRIATLADCCHMSETHFRRVFHEIMAVSPLEYIHMVRIDKACTLLRTSDLSMETIGRRVGYAVVSTFNRNFRQITGVTPLQWKKRPDNYEQLLHNYRIVNLRGWE